MTRAFEVNEKNKNGGKIVDFAAERKMCYKHILQARGYTQLHVEGFRRKRGTNEYSLLNSGKR